MKKTIMLIAAPLVAPMMPMPAVAAPAKAKTKDRIVQCEITDPSVLFKGPCSFIPDGGGSFTIEPVKDGAKLFDNVFFLTLWVTSPGKGSLVAGTDTLTTHEGDFTRSAAHPACWVGDGGGMTMCVR